MQKYCYCLVIFRYYPALKTLEQLEHLHLPRVANYGFSQKMKESNVCILIFY